MTISFGKLTIAVLIAGSTLMSGVTVNAATKTEVKATNQYNALKPGMTIAQVAKVIYGKEYKKQLMQKGGSTVLKQKAEMTSNTNGQKMLGYSVYDKKVVFPLDMTTLMFMTKKNDSLYRLTSKSLDLFRDDMSSGFRESKMKLVKGGKIKTNMTEKQLDAVLSGKGLGEWAGLDTIDMTSIQTKKELDLGLGIKGRSKTYIFPTTTKTKKLVMLDYDAKKKTYVVSGEASL